MIFLEFPHSHYCEAARWALDLKGARYQRKTLLPLLHKFQVERIAPKSSLPVLVDGERVIQGARQIIDFCEQRYGGTPLIPDAHSGPDSDRQAATIRDIEKRADKNIGIPLRAILYDRLLDDRPAIEACFMQGSGTYRRWMFRAMYPATKRIIRKIYIPSPDYVAAAKVNFREEIKWLNDKIAGRDFLVGERLTRADIMVASMLSIGVLPKEHSCHWPQINDPELISFLDEYRDSPIFAWVRQVYSRHRNNGLVEHSGSV